jgi:hypothetical protein
MYNLENALQASTNMFDPKGTKLDPTVSPVDEATGTFSFKVMVTLKQPLKL